MQAVKVKPTKKNACIAIKLIKQFFKEYEGQTYHNSSVKTMQTELAKGQTQLIIDNYNKAVGVVNFDGRGKGNVDYWTINVFFLLKGYRGNGAGTAIRNQLCDSEIENKPIVGTVVTVKRFLDRLQYWYNNGFNYYLPALTTSDSSDNSLIMLWKKSPYNDFTPKGTIEKLLVEETTNV
jgi:hypothetical protein